MYIATSYMYGTQNLLFSTYCGIYEPNNEVVSLGKLIVSITSYIHLYTSCMHDG